MFKGKAGRRGTTIRSHSPCPPASAAPVRSGSKTSELSFAVMVNLMSARLTGSTPSSATFRCYVLEIFDLIC
jgi:hypothetical protein